MTTARNGHLPSLGWSPTNPRMVTLQKEVYYRLGIWHLDLTHKLRPGDNCQSWSPAIPRMVTNQPKDGHPPRRKYDTDSELGTETPKNKICYRFRTWHLDLSHKPSLGWWSPIILRMVTHQPKDGHPPEGSMLQNRNFALRLNSQDYKVSWHSRRISFFIISWLI